VLFCAAPYILPVTLVAQTHVRARHGVLYAQLLLFSGEQVAYAATLGCFVLITYVQGVS